MTLRRLFCPEAMALSELVAQRTVLLDAEEAHYARSVLRLADGSSVLALDGRGGSVVATLQHVGRKEAELIAGDVPVTPERKHRRLHLIMPAAKGERTDWLIEKTTEMGVHTIVFARFARSVVAAEGASKWQRWRRLSRAAARQAQHGRLPNLLKAGSLREAISNMSDVGGARIVAHPDEQPREVVDLLAPADAATWIIGPEGGLTTDELRLLAEHDYTAVTLGPHILRMETAAMVALAASIVVPLPKTGPDRG